MAVESRKKKVTAPTVDDEPREVYEIEQEDENQSTLEVHEHLTDYITGQPLKLNDLEQIRQEEQRKLIEEFGYPESQKTDLIRRDFRVRPKQLSARKFPILVLRSRSGKQETDEQRLYILIEIQKPKVKADDPS